MSNGFPKRGSAKQDCTFTLKLNHGSYVKILPEVVDIPCGGGNGLRIYDRIDPGAKVTDQNTPGKPSEFQTPLFCGKNVRIPAFVSTDVEMLIHYKGPPGARFKIGYKAVRSSKGPKVPRIASTRDEAIQDLNKWKNQLKKMQKNKISNYAAGGGGSSPNENWSVSAPEWKPPGNNPVQLKNHRGGGNHNAYDYYQGNNNARNNYNYNYGNNNYGNRGGFGRNNGPNLNNHGPYEPKEDYGVYDFEAFDEEETPKQGLGSRTAAPGESTVATTTRTEATTDEQKEEDQPPSFEEAEKDKKDAKEKPKE
ncbi:Oidioi.mRNA.OKI2018_I69.PAR.g10778.t1.cds [Oikopleura dioica]|uniref:Oidioi.mRNA.OKI2018_I69.PAR.g10778.t1.cds n=1 Tax=Oikopleura dioica TaxID=34765 RepID=A0ABN7RWL2_OIKDI|nr:Oidioi.mRNA.OKI2018_I69.PAR.g10778.t1.cds [Oikopleura dioica]